MHAGKIVFAQLTDLIHPEQFRRCVRRYNGNYKVKSFPCWNQFLYMAFGQLTFRESLRDMETCLGSRQEQLRGSRSDPNVIENCGFQNSYYFGVMRYVIVDLEATCWMGRPVPQRMEIIEIGSVLLASDTGPIQQEFASFVRPLNEPNLSAFCMGLTGIRQQEIDKAEDFSRVFPRFLDWIGPEPYRLCSWSTYDLNQFKTDCARHGLSFPPQFSNHVNLKQEFARIEGVRPCGMKRALAMCQLQVEGKPHRGLDDARSITKLALRRILPQISG